MIQGTELQTIEDGVITELGDAEIPQQDEDTKKLLGDEGDEGHEEHKVTFRSYPQLLSENKPFCILWVGSIVSLLGDWLTEIACFALLGDYGASSSLISLFLWTKELPYTIFGPFAGVISDMFDRRKVMVIMDIIRMIFVLGYLFVRSKSAIWLIITLSFIQTALSAFFGPARLAMIPMLVPKHKLIVANTIEGSTWSAMFLVGSALGGAIAYLFGTKVNFLLDSVTYLGSAILISMLFKYPYNPKSESEAEGEAQAKSEQEEPEIQTQNIILKCMILWFQSIKIAYHYLKANKDIFIICTVKFFGTLVWSGFDLVTVRFGQHDFKIGADGSLSLSILYAAAGLGAMLAPFLASLITKDTLKINMRNVVIGFCIMTCGVFLSAVSPVLPVACAAATIRGAGIGLLWSFSDVLKEKLVPQHLLGRVDSFDMAIIPIGTLLSRAVGSILLDKFFFTSFHLAFVYAALSFVISMGWVARLVVATKDQT